MKPDTLENEVLTAALSEAVAVQRARTLATALLSRKTGLGAVLASTREELADLGFDAAAIALLRQLRAEMRASLVRSLSERPVHDCAEAFSEYAELVRASLGPGELCLVVFGADNSVQAELTCRIGDLCAGAPRFEDGARQRRLEAGHGYRLIHQQAGHGVDRLAGAVAACCRAAGLTPVETELEEVDRWQRRVHSI